MTITQRVATTTQTSIILFLLPVLFFLLTTTAKSSHSFLLQTIFKKRSLFFALHQQTTTIYNIIMMMNDQSVTENNNNNNNNNNMTIKAILFDMDGTLLDTEALSDKAALMSFGSCLPNSVFEQSPMKEYRLPWELKKQILGLRGAEWIPIVIKYAQQHWNVIETPPTADEFWKSWEDNLNSYCEEITACAGANELVQEFAKLNLPMAIGTSSRMVGVSKKRVRHELMFQHFPIIVTGDHPAVQNGKPAPDIYIQAAKQVNVSPQNCLVFEDAMSGVKSAKAAGCQVVAIPDVRFSQKEKEIFQNEANVVLDTLWEFDGNEFGIPCINMKEKKKKNSEMK